MCPGRDRAPVGLLLNLPPSSNVPGPMLSPSFSSNNPFRRAASPSPAIPTYYNSSTAGTPPAVKQPERPMSTNPFLDDSEVARLQQQPARPVQIPDDIFVSSLGVITVVVVVCAAHPPPCTSPVAKQGCVIHPSRILSCLTALSRCVLYTCR